MRTLKYRHHKYLASRTVFSEGAGGVYTSTLSEPIVSLRSDGGCGKLLTPVACSGVGLTGSLFTRLLADTVPSKGTCIKNSMPISVLTPQNRVPFPTFPKSKALITCPK